MRVTYKVSLDFVLMNAKSVLVKIVLKNRIIVLFNLNGKNKIKNTLQSVICSHLSQKERQHFKNGKVSLII